MPSTRRRLLVAATTAAVVGAGGALATAHGHPTSDAAPWVRVVGRGPTIVFVHGLLGTHAYWGTAYDALAADHRLVFVDLPGFGRSVDVRGPYDVGAHAARIAALWPRGERAWLVGHSMGALVALRAAAARDDVAGVVAFAVPAYRSPAEARALLARGGAMERWIAEGSPLARLMCALHDRTRPLVRAIAPALAPKLPADVARGGVDHTWESFHDGFTSIVSATPRAWIDAAKAPVHVALARDDEVAPASIAAAVLGGTRAVVDVLDGGHHAPIERPPEWLAYARRAIAGA